MFIKASLINDQSANIINLYDGKLIFLRHAILVCIRADIKRATHVERKYHELAKLKGNSKPSDGLNN